MNTLTKLAMGLIGQLKPEPAKGDVADVIQLPLADTSGGLPLMQALALRLSQREFAPEPLLSNLLWAATGLIKKLSQSMESRSTWLRSGRATG